MYALGAVSLITTAINQKRLPIDLIRPFDRKAVAALWLLSCVSIAHGQSSDVGIDVEHLTRQ